MKSSTAAGPWLAALVLMGPAPASAQEVGACEGGVACGPSGSFHVDTFPTTAGVDFTRFPALPARSPTGSPYAPGAGHRTWHVATTGSDDAAGTEGAPLGTIGRAVALAPQDSAYGLEIPADKGGIVLAAAHVGGARLVPSTPASAAEGGNRYGIGAAADDLVIDGFVLSGFNGGDAITFGRLASPQHGLVLAHLRIDDNGQEHSQRGVGGQGGNAIASAYREIGACCLPGGDCREIEPAACWTATGHDGAPPDPCGDCAQPRPQDCDATAFDFYCATFHSGQACEYPAGCGVTLDHVQPGAQPLIEGLLVRDVRIADHLGIGFSCGQGPCNDVRLEGLVIELVSGGSESSGADAVAFERGDNVVVFNADISGADADGLDSKASRIAVVNTIVHDVGRNGIKVWRGGDVINSATYGTGADAAVVFDQGGAYRLLNCYVGRHLQCLRCAGDCADCTSYAATANFQPWCARHLRAAGSLAIVNSVFFANAGGSFLSPDFGLLIHDLLFFGTRGGRYLDWQPVAAFDATGCDVHDPCANPNDPYFSDHACDPYDHLTYYGGEGNPTATQLAANGCDCVDVGFDQDPAPVQSQEGPFTLDALRWQVGSPAVDGGKPAAQAFPSFDLLGNPRSRGAAPDLGPIESDPDVAQDGDGDGVPDASDNCPSVANSGQDDADGDAVGDACDDCRDVADVDQADANHDGTGDACDVEPPGPGDHPGDANGSGRPTVADVVEIIRELSRLSALRTAADVDGDGVLDREDLAAAVELVLQAPVTAVTEDCATPGDEDGDGRADCADDACATGPQGVTCERPERACADEADNDGDGSTDCTDADCIASCGVAYSGAFPAPQDIPQDPPAPAAATLTVAGLERSVHVYVAPTHPLHPALLIMLHGSNGNGRDFIVDSSNAVGYDESISNGPEPGVVIAAPSARTMPEGDWDNHQGGEQYWQTWPDVDPSSNADLLLVRAIIQEAIRAYDVDPKRIYVLGFSNGAFFAETVAFALRDQVAAFAETGGGLVTLEHSQDCAFNCGACALSCEDLRSQPGYCGGGDMEKPIAIPTAAGARRVPGWLAHAVNDDTVSPAYTCTLASRMQDLGYEVLLHLRHDTPDSAHSMPFDFPSQVWPFFMDHPLP